MLPDLGDAPWGRAAQITQGHQLAWLHRNRPVYHPDLGIAAKKGHFAIARIYRRTACLVSTEAIGDGTNR